MFSGYLSTSIRTLFCPKQVGAILAKMWANGGMARKNAAIMLNSMRKTLHPLSGVFVNTA
jgi:hypothetical protein